MERTSRLSLSLAGLLCLALFGCGGGGNPPMTQPAVPFSSGLYTISGSYDSLAFAFNIYGSLMQSGNSVSGIMHTDSPCFAFATDIPVTGTLADDANLTVSLSITLPNGQVLTLNLIHPGGHLTELSGSFTINGAGCLATGHGTVVGSAIPISGAWSGTLTVNFLTVGAIQLNLTQIGPDAHGFFSAKGTATISGGACFASASVDPATVIIGTHSEIVLDNSQAGTTGKLTLSGTVLPAQFAGAAFEGSYTAVQGSCSESGIVRAGLPAFP